MDSHPHTQMNDHEHIMNVDMQAKLATIGKSTSIKKHQGVIKLSIDLHTQELTHEISDNSNHKWEHIYCTSTAL